MTLEAAPAMRTRLHGPALWVAWAALGLLSLVGIGILVLYLPQAYAIFAQPEQTSFAPELAALSISMPIYAAFRLAIEVVFICTFLFISGVLFLRKPDDWMVLLVSFTLATFVFLGLSASEDLMNTSRWWGYGLGFFRAAGLTSSFIVFFLLFPNGHFEPPAARWLALLWGGLCLIWLLSPEAYFNMVYGRSFMATLAPSLTLFLTVYSAGILAQVYRYRQVSNQTERQQTRWAVLGLAAAVFGFGLFYAPLALFPADFQHGLPGLLHGLVLTPLFYALVMLTPVLLAFSVLRYRLWEMKRFIGRSLVSGIVTVILALVYFGSMLLLQRFFLYFTGGWAEVAIVISTLGTAALFQPVRRVVKRRMEKALYGRSDATRVAARFGKALLNSPADLDALSQRLTGVVKDTLHCENVSLWLVEAPRLPRERQEPHEA